MSLNPQTGGALVELGKNLSAAGNTVLEMFKDSFVTPFAIERQARAKVRAYEIEEIGVALVDEKKRDLMQRGLIRMATEAAERQEVLEAVVVEAATLIQNQQRVQEPTKDWKANFISHAEMALDGEVRSRWAKILAEEVVNPGSFSKRTLSVLSDLSKEEALYFTDLRRFYVGFNAIVFQLDDPIYHHHGVTFSTLLALENAGLLNLSEGIGSFARLEFKPRTVLEYFGRHIIINTPGKEFPLGRVSLTREGLQLAQIVKTSAVEGFVDYVLQKWRPQGAAELLPTNPPTARFANQAGQIVTMVYDPNTMEYTPIT